jgi:chromate transporter
VIKPEKNIDNQSSKISAIELALIFLKTGAFAFGGWSTTIVLIEKHLGAMTPDVASIDIKGAASYAQILPGATQVAIVSNVGYQLQGIKGAFVATISYLTPAITLMVLFA